MKLHANEKEERTVIINIGMNRYCLRRVFLEKSPGDNFLVDNHYALTRGALNTETFR
jgi:DNA-directed RNA polymerase subunit N (RpoN/RPB10)